MSSFASFLQANIVHNQPYDESVDVSDGEEIASTSATPRGTDAHPAAGMYGHDRILTSIRMGLGLQWWLSFEVGLGWNQCL